LTSSEKTKEVEKGVERHKPSASTNGRWARQTTRGVLKGKRPTKGRSIKGGRIIPLLRKGDTWYLCSFFWLRSSSYGEWAYSESNGSPLGEGLDAEP
jgi:hypothetical protein